MILISFGVLFSFDDILCLSNSTSLNELSMDGNPFAIDPTYKQVILRNLSNLRQLDMKRISVRILYKTQIHVCVLVSVHVCTSHGRERLQAYTPLPSWFLLPVYALCFS